MTANVDAARDIKMCVRAPIGLFLCFLSIPKTAPMNVAKRSLYNM